MRFIGIAVGLVGASSFASAFTMFFNYSIGPGSPPVGATTPFASLTVTQNGADRVDFVLNNLLPSIGSGTNDLRLERVYFNANFSGGFTSSGLVNVDTINPNPGPPYNRAGYGPFEFLVTFNPGFIGPAESASWSLTRAGGLLESDFNVFSNGNIYAIAHVLSDNNGDSQHLLATGGGDPPDEIPGPAAILPFAVAGLASMRRRRRA